MPTAVATPAVGLLSHFDVFFRYFFFFFHAALCYSLLLFYAAYYDAMLRFFAAAAAYFSPLLFFAACLMITPCCLPDDAYADATPIYAAASPCRRYVISLFRATPLYYRRHIISLLMPAAMPPPCRCFAFDAIAMLIYAFSMPLRFDFDIYADVDAACFSPCYCYAFAADAASYAAIVCHATLSFRYLFFMMLAACRYFDDGYYFAVAAIVLLMLLLMSPSDAIFCAATLMLSATTPPPDLLMLCAIPFSPHIFFRIFAYLL